MMKRKILSFLLALCMVVTIVPASALAAGGTSSSVGEINVTVKQTLSSKDTTFKATVDGGSEITLLRDADNATLTGKFADLAAGMHTVAISAPNYLTYTQQIEVKASSSAGITVYDDASVNTVQQSNKKFGVIPFGDMNNDGQINDSDADLVTQGINDTKQDNYDLNGDGVEDIADVSYVVRSTKQTNASVAYTLSAAALEEEVEATVDEEKVEVQFSSATNGEAPKTLKEALFSESKDSYVSLAPKGGETISASNPIEISLDMGNNSAPVEAVTISPPFDTTNAITDGTILVDGIEEDTGKEVTIEAQVSKTRAANGIRSKIADTFSLAAGAETAESNVENSGTIVINLGKKVAIKKITIKVTGTASGKLADIAKVEFFEDFADRIPEPQLSIPEIIADSVSNTDGEYKALTFSWTRQTNISGYEISIAGSGVNVTRSTTETSYTFTSSSTEKLKAYSLYELKVRAYSGDWKSDWSPTVKYEIIPNVKPPAPEYLAAKPGAGSLDLSWRDLWDTKSWSVFYRQKSTGGSYTEVKNITKNSYRLENLKSGVTYEFYVVAHNDIGDSPASATAEGTPILASGVQMPEYKIINGKSDRMKGIKSIKSGNNRNDATLYKADGSSMPLNSATEEDWKVIVDENPNSYVFIGDWDSGVEYQNFRGPAITLTEKRTIDTIRFTASQSVNNSISGAKIKYTDDGGAKLEVACSLNTKMDSQGLTYYEIRMAHPITTDYLEVGIQGSSYSRRMSIAELRLYEYDSIENDIRALFTDEMRSALVPNTTQETINALKTKANTADPASGEYHPNQATILSDLQYAEELLKHSSTDAPITINTNITSGADGHENTALPVSDLQPLGYVGATGDQIVVYVSSKNGNVGEATNLKLAMTQYHPQVSSWQRAADNYLKIGRNEITLPEITSDAKEKGGSLYVYYDGKKGAAQYTVRVQGATKIPMLNVEGLTGDARKNAITEYVEELGLYAANDLVQTKHNQLHGSNGKENITNYDYNAKECFLNSTEIVMNNMFFSFPATQVWGALGDSGNQPGTVTKLENAIAAMEQEVDLFYQFKGFNKNPALTCDRYPTRRLNIRYHQMFTGAFMYAGGKHIGIEWGSVGGLFNTTPYDPNTGTGGKYSGWGIAHEIGHVINDASYTTVEVTNNIFAQLANAATLGEDNDDFRTTYDKVYKAVIAGNTGHTGDLAVQLAMFWQLHLAYDNQPAYKFYEDSAQQKANLFYARVDSYMRSPSQNKIEIPTTNKTKDDYFMRVCCAAAQKDLLDFFRAWGFTPNQDTVNYASQFDKETRKIQYIDDDSRKYRMDGGQGAAGLQLTASVSKNEGNTVTISLGNTSSDTGTNLLGYEIIREDCQSSKVVGFVPASETEFKDVVATENNKAFVYTVKAIDRLMNVVDTEVLPEIKVKHDGSIGKAKWSASTNMLSDTDTMIDTNSFKENLYDPDEYVVPNGTTTEPNTTKRSVSSIGFVTDGNYGNSYTGKTANEKNGAQIVINLGGSEQITGFKYTKAGSYDIENFKFEISNTGNDNDWKTVKTGNFSTSTGSDFKTEGNSVTVYFNEVDGSGRVTTPWMCTYDAEFVRLTATSQNTISLAELDLLSPANDNVELTHIGVMAEDYNYSRDKSDPEAVIKQGTIVFYGTYVGDPAYNVVLPHDQNGYLFNGYQIIFAEVADEGYLGKTNDGAWIYCLETDKDGVTPEQRMQNVTKIQADLYRVEDAQELTGQRLTSTSLFMDKPGSLPQINLNSQLATDGAPTTPGSAATPHTVASQSDASVISMQQAQVIKAKSNVTSLENMNNGTTAYASLTPNNTSGVDFTITPGRLSIGAKLTIDMDDVPETVNIGWTNNSNNALYQSYYYDNTNSLLYLYSIARTGLLGDAGDSITGSISAPFVDTINYQITDLSMLNEAHSVEAAMPSNKEQVTLSKGLNVSKFCPKDNTCVLAKYSDVSAAEWYHDGVHYMLQNAYMIGTAYNTFQPGMNITRAMVTQMLYAKAGWPKVATAPKFTDVQKGLWYTDAIVWAAENDVVTGFPDNTFRPDENITRQDLAVMIHSAAGDPKVQASLADYPDQASVGSWATDAIQWAVSSGIITGNRAADGTLILDPTGKATRAQTATMLMQCFTMAT